MPMPRQHRQLDYLAKMLKQPLRKMLQQVRESTPPASHRLTAASPRAGPSGVCRGPLGCRHATAPPSPARVSSVTGPRDRKAGRPAPLQPPLPPPGRAADTPCTDGDPDLLTGLKFLLKRSSDHRTSGPVGGGSPGPHRGLEPWTWGWEVCSGGNRLLPREGFPPPALLDADGHAHPKGSP